MTAPRSILDPTGNEAAEREAMAQVERPGVWSGEAGSDLRALTQYETDMLIRAELWFSASDADRPEVLGAVGGSVPGLAMRPVPLSGALDIPSSTARMDCGPSCMRAIRQRGGIDSDPLVRLLAFRAWGDRDRQWFELRGVHKGDEVGAPPFGLVTAEGVLVSLAWPGDQLIGRATHDARPGEVFTIDRPLCWNANHLRCRVSDRLRIAPDTSAAFGTGKWSTPNGQITIEETPADRLGPGDVVVSSITANTLTLERRSDRIQRHFDAQEARRSSAPTVPPWARERRR